MSSIIVVFPKIEDAKIIKNLVIRNGFEVAAVCTTGGQAAAVIEELDEGIVVCGYKFSDMFYSHLHDCLPELVDMLLVASPRVLNECLDNDIVCLSMPIKAYDLLNTVEMMLQNIARKKKKQKMQKRQRTPEEQKIVEEAKLLLMERNNMTEEEAHRYIQKNSMDSGSNMVETARMVIRTII